MKRVLLYVFTLTGLLALNLACSESTQETDASVSQTHTAVVDFKGEVERDIAAFRQYYANKFPNIDPDAFQDGVYAIDEASREQWLEIEEFPPYEFAVDSGKALFEMPFANGGTYAGCFANGGIGVKQNYPYFDTTANEVVTLELTINRCRISNGEQPLAYKTGDMASLAAYMAFTSRGNRFAVAIPNEAAYEAYQQGKKFFYSKRGQLNFACADCHMRVSGQKLRADILSPALGHPTGFPVYRAKWEDMGTLHRRYIGCNRNIGAMPLAAQSTEYRNLEFFQTILSNGLAINGPSSRK